MSDADVAAAPTLPDATRAILREADAAILNMAGESHHLLYRYVHHTIARLCRADAFYVAFLLEGQGLARPYTSDDSEYDTGTGTYGEEGMVAWVVRHRRAYWSREDDSQTLRHSRPVGNRERRSAEAIVAPLFEPDASGGFGADARMVGILSVQSYEMDSYNAATVQAVQWLANSVGIVLKRERENQTRLRDLGAGPEQGADTEQRWDVLFGQTLARMSDVRRRVRAVQQRYAGEDSNLAAALDELGVECERHQTEILETYVRLARADERPLSRLSEQERRIVGLLVEGFTRSRAGYSNRDMADRLHISEDTVKTHLRSIFRKLGIPGRTGVAELARPYFSPPRPGQ